ncbi:MAG: hypothetical protein IJ228_06255 [Succinivibrio sp.]|nr:hypothetical protein [Succinivibrio sp.]
MDRDRVWAYEIGLRDPDIGLSALHIFALEDSDDDGDEDEFDPEKYEVGPLADYGMSLCGEYYLTLLLQFDFRLKPLA